jgi:hypothetical protein
MDRDLREFFIKFGHANVHNFLYLQLYIFVISLIIYWVIDMFLHIYVNMIYYNIYYICKCHTVISVTSCLKNVYIIRPLFIYTPFLIGTHILSRNFLIHFLFIYTMYNNDTHKRKISSIYIIAGLFRTYSLSKKQPYLKHSKQFCMFLTRKI